MQQMSAQASPATPEAEIDDLAPVNRFAVTIRVGHPKPERQRVEVLGRRQYALCRFIQGEITREQGEVVAVTGYSFRDYDFARAIAQLHLRRLQAQSA